jgi:acyl carrier protein
MAKPRRHGVEQGLQGPMTTSPNTKSEAGEAALDRELKALIADVLGLDQAQAAAFGPDSGLFGHLPELDSMAVAGLLTEMEDRLGIVIEDDDVDGEMLETYGGLLAFARAKLDPR